MNHENRFHVEARQILSVTTRAEVVLLPFLEVRMVKSVHGMLAGLTGSVPVLEECGEKQRSQIESVHSPADHRGHENY